MCLSVQQVALLTEYLSWREAQAARDQHTTIIHVTIHVSWREAQAAGDQHTTTIHVTIHVTIRITIHVF